MMMLPLCSVQTFHSLFSSLSSSFFFYVLLCLIIYCTEPPFIIVLHVFLSFLCYVLLMEKKTTQIELKLNWIFYPGIICDIYRAMNNKYFENKNIYIYEELYFIKKIKGKNCCRIKGKLMRLLQRVRVYITGIVLLNLV